MIHLTMHMYMLQSHKCAHSWFSTVTYYCCAVGAYLNELVLKVLVELCLVNALFTQYSNQVALYQGCTQKIKNSLVFTVCARAAVSVHFFKIVYVANSM